MRNLAVVAILTLVLVAIGTLAVLGARKARSMSRAHIADLKETGMMERLVHPKTRHDFFLRPMTFGNIVSALIGAVIFVAGVRLVQHLLGW